MSDKIKSPTQLNGSDLSSILTHDFLLATLRELVPFPQQGAIDFAEVSEFFFGEGQGSVFEAGLRRLCFPALLAMSKLGPNAENIPDLMKFLPDPSSNEFVEQATGLILLLDQGPRALFDGIDMRWSGGFFDVLALTLSKQLMALPELLRIDVSLRWTNELGTSFEYWVIMWIWIVAPFVHSEDLELHRMRQQLGEELRLIIEKRTGKMDPWRKTQTKDSTDVLLFSQRVKCPPTGHVEMEDFLFWMLMILDVHIPIIAKFGRYPYRNRMMGRNTTEEELKFLEDTKHFGEVGEEATRRIKEDINAGRWTPLQE